jgi:hypothetical protein
MASGPIVSVLSRGPSLVERTPLFERALILARGLIVVRRADGLPSRGDIAEFGGLQVDGRREGSRDSASVIGVIPGDASRMGAGLPELMLIAAAGSSCFTPGVVGSLSTGPVIVAPDHVEDRLLGSLPFADSRI